MIRFMETEEKKRLEEDLMALRDRLSGEMRDVVKGADLGSEGDTEEAEDEAEERGVAYAAQIALKERLGHVLDALEKLKADTYGICESCHGAIAPEVLREMPESRQCAACKAK